MITSAPPAAIRQAQAQGPAVRQPDAPPARTDQVALGNVRGRTVALFLLATVAATAFRWSSRRPPSIQTRARMDRSDETELEFELELPR